MWKSLSRNRILPRSVLFTLFVLLPLFATIAICAENEADPLEPVHKGSKVLTNGNLIVEIMDPNDPERYNQGVRFAPLAAILRVDMGEDEYLHNPIEHNPQTSHAGLAPEFDLLNVPSSFEEAKVGEGFVEIGIGVLEKITEKYRYSLPFKIVELAPTTVEWGETTATFKQSCPGVRGYAYDLEAEVVLRGKAIDVNWKLSNTGTQPFATEQYIHNWFVFNHRPVGPDYIMTFPYEITPKDVKPEQEVDGRHLKFMQEIPTVANIEVPWPDDYKGTNEIMVRNVATGQWILSRVSVPGAYTAVHAKKAYICPEMFININLAPGESQEWTRTYIFGKTKPAPMPVTQPKDTPIVE